MQQAHSGAAVALIMYSVNQQHCEDYCDTTARFQSEDLLVATQSGSLVFPSMYYCDLLFWFKTKKNKPAPSYSSFLWQSQTRKPGFP